MIFNKKISTESRWILFDAVSLPRLWLGTHLYRQHPSFEEPPRHFYETSVKSKKSLLGNLIAYFHNQVATAISHATKTLGGPLALPYDHLQLQFYQILISGRHIFQLNLRTLCRWFKVPHFRHF